MKKIGNEIFSAEINSPSIEVVSVQLMKDVPTLMQSAIYGALCRIYCKNGVLTIHFSLSSWQISKKFLPQLPDQTLRFLKITVNIVNRSGIDQILGNWITFFFSHISSCDILAALPWLICNVWGTLFVSSNGRRRREYMWWEGILFIPSKNNSGIHIK